MECENAAVSRGQGEFSTPEALLEREKRSCRVIKSCNFFFFNDIKSAHVYIKAKPSKKEKHRYSLHFLREKSFKPKHFIKKKKKTFISRASDFVARTHTHTHTHARTHTRSTHTQIQNKSGRGVTVWPCGENKKSTITPSSAGLPCVTPALSG